MLRSSVSIGAMAVLVWLAGGACDSTRLSLPPDPGPAGAGGARGIGGRDFGGTGGHGGVSGAGGRPFSSDGGASGTGGRDGGSDGGDAPFCCPPDRTMSGCMHLGGQSQGGECWLTCDFFCSSNWRIEHDSQGCSVWHYDFNPCDPPGFDAQHPDARD